MVLKKWKSNPKNEMLQFCLKVLFYVSIFPFFISLTKWKKKLSQGHPYNFRLPLQLFFPRFFSSACKLKKQWAQPTWEFTAPPSIWISPKPKKMGILFHQVIPTRIEVFSRWKNTENQRSCACYGLNIIQEIRDVLAPKNTAIYKLAAMPSYSHVRQFTQCGPDPALLESVMWRAPICEPCKI